MHGQDTGSDSIYRPMRYPARWLAVLRMVVGVWFFKSILTKLTVGLAWGVLPIPIASRRWITTMPKLLAKYAAENPFPWYKHFLQGTVIPNAHAFAHLTALAEVGVGFSLLFGVLTPLGAFFALIQVVFYGLAVQHLSAGQLGFHVMLFAMITSFLFARAGRVWGLDVWLRNQWPTAAVLRALT